jgi:rRNA maturation protein Rpf1
VCVDPGHRLLPPEFLELALGRYRQDAAPGGLGEVGVVGSHDGAPVAVTVLLMHAHQLLRGLTLHIFSMRDEACTGKKLPAGLGVWR